MKTLQTKSIFSLFVVALFIAACDLNAPEPIETCNDGMQNQTETGIDCGGPCTACPSCTDGIQNQDETGIDCGGTCLNRCLATLPCSPDTNSIQLSSTTSQFSGSYYSSDPDGNHEFRMTGTNGMSIVVTFSKDFSFQTSGMLELVHWANAGYTIAPLQLVLRIETSLVYGVYNSDARAEIIDDICYLTWCDAPPYSSFSTTSSGMLAFSIVH